MELQEYHIHYRFECPNPNCGTHFIVLAKRTTEWTQLDGQTELFQMKITVRCPFCYKECTHPQGFHAVPISLSKMMDRLDHYFYENFGEKIRSQQEWDKFLRTL